MCMYQFLVNICGAGISGNKLCIAPHVGVIPILSNFSVLILTV